MIVKFLSNKRFNDYIDNLFIDKGCNLFITYDNGLWVACDNSTGQKWVEEFANLNDCYRWLIGEYEL